MANSLKDSSAPADIHASHDNSSVVICTMGAFSDLVNTPKADERAIMTYVSCYYHAFQGAQQVNTRSHISMDPLARHPHPGY